MEASAYMYIHLGGETVIRARDVVAILDLSGEKSGGVAFFLSGDNPLKDVQKVGEEESKSLVVTRAGHYLSPVKAATLKKRI